MNRGCRFVEPKTVGRGGGSGATCDRYIFGRLFNGMNKWVGEH
jgi:hypothetical protein